MAAQTRVGWRPYVTVVQTATYLLDSYSGSAAAYSLRKLRSSYSGSAIRVRRSSDNTELNIGFDSDGNLDTYALSAFVGSVNGFVTTWYDQSGNGSDATQTTASSQPQIVLSGVLHTLNGKPIIKTNTTTSTIYFNTPISNIVNRPLSIITTGKIYQLPTNVYSNTTLYVGAAAGNWSWRYNLNANSTNFANGIEGSTINQNVAAYSTNPFINQAHFGTTTLTSRFNGTDSSMTINDTGQNSSPANFLLMNIPNPFIQITSNMGMFECIFYLNDKTSDRTGIESNINSYYSVYPNPTSVWNLLTAAYNADTTALPSLKTSLVASYNGESNTNDSKGTNNGTAVGGVTYPAGKIGNAFSFNGTNAYVSLPNTSGQFNFDGDFTVSVWFRSSNLSASRYFMTNDQDNGTTWGYGWSFFYSGSLGFTLQLCNGSATNRVSFLSGYSANTWYHVVAVRKMGQKHKIYVNGVDTPAGQYGDVNTPAGYIANQKMDLGGISRLNLFVLCDLDGVNMWNKALTQAEVSELYNSGNGAQYIGDNFYKPTTNDALGTNNGTAQGGLTYGLGKVGTAFQFNGSNAYVALPNNIMKFSNTDNWSVSFWIYATVTGYSGVIGNWDYDGLQGTGWGIRTWTSGSDPSKFSIQLFTNWATGTGNPFPILQTDGTTSVNTWNHFVITRNSSAQEKIYQNGTLVASQTNSSTKLTYPATSYSCIGANRYQSNIVAYAKAGSKIDAMSVWTKELTQTEITELYNSGNGKQYPN